MSDQFHAETTGRLERFQSIGRFCGRNRFEVFFESRFISGDIHDLPIAVLGCVGGALASGRVQGQTQAGGDCPDQAPLLFHHGALNPSFQAWPTPVRWVTGERKVALKEVPSVGIIGYRSPAVFSRPHPLPLATLPRGVLERP